MPTTRPALSTTGPPDWPDSECAVLCSMPVYVTLGSTLVPTSSALSVTSTDSLSPMTRPPTEAGAVSFGYPITTRRSPSVTPADRPSVAVASPDAFSSWSSATSSATFTPIRAAWYVCPVPPIWAVTLSASLITCSSVSTRPAAVSTMPVPALS